MTLKQLRRFAAAATLSLLAQAHASVLTDDSGQWPDGSGKGIMASLYPFDPGDFEFLEITTYGLGLDGLPLAVTAADLTQGLRPYVSVSSVGYTDGLPVISWLQTSGTLRFEGQAVPNFQRGGWFEIRDMRIDLDARTVTGHMAGQTSSGVVIASREMKIFDFLVVEGAPFFWDGSLQNLSLRWMNLTSEAALQVIAPSLDSLVLGRGMWQTAGAFGDIAFAKSTVTPIPEQGTWALMGVGLCGLLLVQHRRAMLASR